MAPSATVPEYLFVMVLSLKVRTTLNETSAPVTLPSVMSVGVPAARRVRGLSGCRSACRRPPSARECSSGPARRCGRPWSRCRFPTDLLVCLGPVPGSIRPSAEQRPSRFLRICLLSVYLFGCLVKATPNAFQQCIGETYPKDRYRAGKSTFFDETRKLKCALCPPNSRCDLLHLLISARIQPWATRRSKNMNPA